MNETIDNQQVKPEELAWLAGFWDGEGTITVFRTKRANGRDRYNASLVLVNTDENVIAHVLKLLDRIGISMHLFTVKHKNHWKDAHQLTTRNMTYISKLLPLLIPFLVCKKAQAEITLRFVSSRLRQREKVGAWTQGTEFSEEEIILAEQLKTLNSKGKSSTTIRSTPKGDDIVYSL